jgi:hypothetical protein
MTTCSADESMDEVRGDDDRPFSPSRTYLDEDDSGDESVESLIERRKMQPLIRLDVEEDDNNDDDSKISKPVVWFKQPLYEAPEFIQRLKGYNEVSVGTSVSFVAQYKAIPAPTVKWYKDEEEVRATDRHHLESSSSDEEGIIRLIITDVKTTDEGAYKCKVENQEGVASTTGYLSVTGGDSRSRQTARTSSRNGKVPSPCRVSSPPLLRPIAEQKSMEESEEIALSLQPPSPLQAFIDGIRHSTKSHHPPICYGAEHIFGRVDDDDSTCGGSDCEDDVFDGEYDKISHTTSSDSADQLLAISPVTTGEDLEISESSTTTTSSSSSSSSSSPSSSTTGAAGCPWAEMNYYTVEVKQSFDHDLDELLPAVNEAPSGQTTSHEDTCTRLSPAELTAAAAAAAADPASVSTRLALESNGRSPSTFHQRRLGRLQQQHRLAIDLCDYIPSTSPPPVSSDVTLSSELTSLTPEGEKLVTTTVLDSSQICLTASSPVPVPIEYNHVTDLGRPLQVVQNAILIATDNPVFQFYTVFVTIAAALANVIEIQPLNLILAVAFASFVSFHMLERQHSLGLFKFRK